MTCASVVATERIAEGKMFPPRSSTISNPEPEEAYLNRDTPPMRISRATKAPVISRLYLLKSIDMVILAKSVFTKSVFNEAKITNWKRIFPATGQNLSDSSQERLFSRNQAGETARG